MTNTQDLKEKMLREIRRILKIHGLVCKNKQCNIKLDCDVDYNLISLFEAELKKAEQKVIEEIVKDLNDLWLKEAPHGEYFTDDFIPQGWTMSGHIIPMIRKRLDHLSPKGELK